MKRISALLLACFASLAFADYPGTTGTSTDTTHSQKNNTGSGVNTGTVVGPTAPLQDTKYKTTTGTMMNINKSNTNTNTNDTGGTDTNSSGSY